MSGNNKRIFRNDTEENVLAATLYAEACGEVKEGKEWVVWVIRNRARLNRSYWGGSNIKDVCLKNGMFECWNGVDSIAINDNRAFENCLGVVKSVMNMDRDPTGGCDHYNNPDKEGYPEWTKNVQRVKKIGNHQFYKGN